MKAGYLWGWLPTRNCCNLNPSAYRTHPKSLQHALLTLRRYPRAIADAVLGLQGYRVYQSSIVEGSIVGQCSLKGQMLSNHLVKRSDSDRFLPLYHKKVTSQSVRTVLLAATVPNAAHEFKSRPPPSPPAPPPPNEGPHV